MLFVGMSLIEFKEIPAANSNEGQQDTFELFARDFLEYNGFKVIVPPGRGADGGIDLLVAEKRRGVLGETTVNWLVSCKHYAHSNRSVGVSDELNILERVRANRAQGFIGFYSTIASSSLIERVNGLDGVEVEFYDGKKIENYLTNSEVGNRLFSRYFPVSHKQWQKNNPARPNLGFKTNVLKCHNCGKKLIDDVSVELSMLVCLEDDKDRMVKKVYWCCKGVCDNLLKMRYRTGSMSEYRWDEMVTYVHPVGFIIKVCDLFAELNNGKRFSHGAESEMHEFITTIYHQVSRELTADERSRWETWFD